MTVRYEDRIAATHLDGTPIFKTEGDERNENLVARLVEEAFPGSKLHSFGALSPIDWYVERHGRMVAVGEVKARTTASTDHTAVFLNVRKWTALSLAEIGLGVPAMYFVKFTDTVKYIALADVDATEHKIGGTRRQVKSRNDREPVILIPVDAMKFLRRPDEAS